MTNTLIAPDEQLAAKPVSPNRKLNTSQEIWERASISVGGQSKKAEAQLRHEGRVPKGGTPIASEVYKLATANLRTKISRAPEDTTYREMMADRFALLVLQAPAATRAVAILKGAVADIDPSKMSPRGRDAVVGDTRQFNLDLAETILDLQPSMFSTFPNLLHDEFTTVAETTGMPVMPQDRLNARINSVRRKVAVWRALRAELPPDYSIRTSDVKEAGHKKDLIVSYGDRQLAISLQGTEDFTEALEDLPSKRFGKQREAEPYIIDCNDGTVIVDVDHFFGKLRHNDFDYDDPKLVSELVLDEFDRLD